MRIPRRDRNSLAGPSGSSSPISHAAIPNLFAARQTRRSSFLQLSTFDFPTMPILALDHLDDHPLNANVMPPDAMAKLTRHIEATGDYPPLIVRRHPQKDPADSGRFQILDGHHRARALRALGYEQARCEIWEADDQRAIMLLLTLNRLHGEDDPRRRGELLEHITATIAIPALTQWLPDDAERIDALLTLARPIEASDLAPPPDPDAMPQAVTFFFTEPQRRELFERLADVADDRSEALVKLLHLGD
jgi:hypothetical protein